MEEVWMDISGSKNYRVSNMGSIWNRATGGFVLPHLCNGYARARITYGKRKYKDERIHRLVATHFVENPDKKPYVNHKDGNQLNNCADNLEWVTCQENMRHFHDEIGTRPKRVKLTFSREGHEDMVFNSIQECANHFGKAPATIWGYSVNGKAYGWKIKREEL